MNISVTSSKNGRTASGEDGAEDKDGAGSRGEGEGEGGEGQGEGAGGAEGETVPGEGGDV